MTASGDGEISVVPQSVHTAAFILILHEVGRFEVTVTMHGIADADDEVSISITHYSYIPFVLYGCIVAQKERPNKNPAPEGGGRISQ